MAETSKVKRVPQNFFWVSSYFKYYINFKPKALKIMNEM